MIIVSFKDDNDYNDLYLGNSSPAKKKDPELTLLKMIIAVLILLVIAAIVGSISYAIKNSNNESYISDKNYETQVTVKSEVKPTFTIGQLNALLRAQEYLKSSHFSYTGIIEQLEFEKYTHDEAVYAATYCGANWDTQAALKAKDYLNSMSFSKEGLIEQLEFEGFTHSQAVYGAKENGYS